MMDIMDTAQLSNELTYSRYLMNNGQMRQYFQDLNMPEYIALHMITQAAPKETGGSGKAYLKELAEKMRLPMHSLSKIVGGLRDRGYLEWAHDGNGSEGTYVVITPSGAKHLGEQEKRLREYNERVIEQYGKENMVQLLEMMKRLEAIMISELEKTEAADDIGTE